MNMDDNYLDFEEPTPEKEKDNKKGIIIAAVGVVLLCCCCIVGGYLFYQYLVDPVVDWVLNLLNL